MLSGLLMDADVAWGCPWHQDLLLATALLILRQDWTKIRRLPDRLLFYTIHSFSPNKYSLSAVKAITCLTYI